MKLSMPMREMLHSLITLYAKKGEYVRSDEIAGYLNRKPGTVRRLMPILCAMGLVRSATGRRGGYRPTSKAYEVLSVTEPEFAEDVPVRVNGETIDASAERLSLHFSGSYCYAKIRFLGDIRKIQSGCLVRVGPAPASGVVVSGEVIGRDETDNSTIVAVMELICLPDGRVEDYMKSVACLQTSDPIENAAGKLAEGCGCLLVRDNTVLGYLTLKHILKAVADGKLRCRVGDLLERRIVAIDKRASIRDSFRLMMREEVEVLVVKDDGEPVGVITEVDILRALDDSLCSSRGLMHAVRPIASV